MVTRTSIALTGAAEAFETCRNILDNLGYLPGDLEFEGNTEARFLIRKVVVNDVCERMTAALPELKAGIRKVEQATGMTADLHRYIRDSLMAVSEIASKALHDDSSDARWALATVNERIERLLRKVEEVAA